jgi:hypothetical protein
VRRKSNKFKWRCGFRQGGYHQWQANLRILGVTEIKTVPYVPLSHPFIERLITDSLV